MDSSKALIGLLVNIIVNKNINVVRLVKIFYS